MIVPASGKKMIALGTFAIFCMLASGCATTTPTFPETASLAATETGPAEEQKPLLEKDSYEELLGKATNYLARGEDQLAKLHFLLAVKKNPRSAPAYTGLGQTFFHERQFRDAGAAFAEALKIDKDFVPALVGAGKLCRAEGKYDKAANHLRKALALRPNDPVVLTELAITLDSRNEGQQTEPFYRKVVELKPEDASARNNLGFNCLLQGRYSEAIAELRKAMTLAPTDRRIENNLAAAYALSGKEEDAFSLLVQTVGKAGAYNDIGYIFMTQGEWDKAKKAFQNALQADPAFYAKAKNNLEHLRRLRHQSVLDGTGGRNAEQGQGIDMQEKDGLKS